MMLRYFRQIGITLAFTLMAIAYVGVVWGLVAAGYEVVPGQSLGTLTGQLVSFVLYAVCGGVMADLSRFAIAALWRLTARPKSRRDDYATHSYA